MTTDRETKKLLKQSDKLTPRIMRKWREQGGFIRFLDGDTGNCAIHNLMWVSIKDAIEHIEDWKVDWDMNLTEKEAALVRCVEWRAGLSFKKN